MEEVTDVGHVELEHETRGHIVFSRPFECGLCLVVVKVGEYLLELLKLIR